MRYRTDTVSLYVHAGLGADGNDGTSAAAPLASTLAALDRIPSAPWGQRFKIGYLPGHVETIDRLILPPILGAGPVDDVGVDGDDPAVDYPRPQIRLISLPRVLETVNGTISIADPTSTLVMITDPAKAWTPGEHVGRTIINPGQPAEIGIVGANTATELLVTMVRESLSGGVVQIMERQAHLNVPRGIQIQATTAALAFIGLTITSAGAPALDVLNPGFVQVLACDIVGGIQTRDACGRLEVQASHLTGGFLALNAGRIAIRQSLMSGMRTAFHGVAGQYDVYGCMVDDCEPLGHAGTGTPQGGFRVDNCWLRRPRAHGIVGYGGNRCRVTYTRVDDAQGDAIYLDGPGATRIDTVTGEGSTGHGCVIVNGATANVQGQTTVRGNARVDAGDAGEVLVDGAAQRWTAGHVAGAFGSRLA